MQRYAKARTAATPAHLFSDTSPAQKYPLPSRHTSPEGKKKRPKPAVSVPELCDALLRHSLLLDTSLLTGEITQVVDTRAAYDTHLVHLDLVDVG